jgi:hypothetical protein
MRSILLATLVGLLTVRLLAGAEERAPVPAPAAQAKAEESIKDIFKTEYAKRTQSARLELAAWLYQHALATKDDLAAKFVLLREARDLASAAGDPLGALIAVDVMAREFAVNGFEMKAKVLDTVSAKTRTANANVNLVLGAVEVLDAAIAEDNFTAAAPLLKMAQTAAGRTNNNRLTAAVEARARDLERIQQEFKRFQDASTALKNNPEDPQANLTAGKYLCLVKGAWKEGLPHLARGGDAKLKALARQDLSAPAEAARQAEIGDGWWDLGKDESGLTKLQLQRRAYSWYQQAVGGELEPLAKTKVAMRLQELERLPGVTRYFVLPIERAATTSTFRPIFSGTGNDMLKLPAWGMQKVFDVPFKLIDPAEGKVRNAIVLNCPHGAASKNYPLAVRLPCNSPARAVHLLGCVSGWGFPTTRERSVSMMVRFHYQDGSRETRYLINGVHLVDWFRDVEVHGSRRALQHGQAQIRYLAIRPLKVSTPIKYIDLLKGRDKTGPIILGLTVEKPNL